MTEWEALEKPPTKWKEALPRVWRVLREILSGTMYALIILIVAFVFLAWLGKPEGIKIPFLGRRFYSQHYATFVVTNGSMEPTLRLGDLAVFVRPSELRPGMIAAFRLRDGRDIVHRIVRITDEGFIITRGDVNNCEDRWFDDNGEYHLVYVPVVYSGIRIPWIGFLSEDFRNASSARGEFAEEQSVSAEFKAATVFPTP